MTTQYEYNKKWRHDHPETRHRGKKRYYSKTQGAPNSGKPWTGDELKQVLAHEIPDSELAAKIGRSVQAIQVMRSKNTKQPVEEER